MLSEAELKYPSCRPQKWKDKTGRVQRISWACGKSAPDISGEKVMDSENRKQFHMRSIICDLLFLPTFQICAVFIFLHSPWPKTNPVYNRLFSIWFYSLPFLFWSSLRLFVAQHVQHLCNTMFSGTLIFPVALHHAVLYLLSKALLGLGTSCASWQRERKWKENVVVPLPTAIQQIKTEKRAMCAFTDGV